MEIEKGKDQEYTVLALILVTIWALSAFNEVLIH